MSEFCTYPLHGPFLDKQNVCLHEACGACDSGLVHVQVRQGEGAVPRWLCHSAHTPCCLHTCQLDTHQPNRCVLQLLPSPQNLSEQVWLLWWSLSVCLNVLCNGNQTQNCLMLSLDLHPDSTHTANNRLLWSDVPADVRGKGQLPAICRHWQAKSKP